MRSARAMKINKKSGLIQFILVIVIAVAILGYLGIDLKTFAESEGVRKNVSYTISAGKSLWSNHLKQPALAAWNAVAVKLIWDRGVMRFFGDEDETGEQATTTPVQQSAVATTTH